MSRLNGFFDRDRNLGSRTLGPWHRTDYLQLYGKIHIYVENILVIISKIFFKKITCLGTIKLKKEIIAHKFNNVNLNMTYGFVNSQACQVLAVVSRCINLLLGSGSDWVRACSESPTECSDNIITSRVKKSEDC